VDCKSFSVLSFRIRERGLGDPRKLEINNPLSLLDELTIADDLMEYSDREFTIFLITNGSSYSVRSDD
jgi:hypothetical protein